MELLELGIMFVFGLIVGSFLNVLILRLNTGRSNSGRSGCMSCLSKLSVGELIPLVSFFALRGRCKSCGSRISHQYWLVELITGLLFVAVWMQGFAHIQTFFALLIVALLMVILVYDMRHTIIPNKIVYPFIALGFLMHIPVAGTFSSSEVLLYIGLVFASAALVALPLFVLWAISRGRWMGFGDVKLVFGFGLLLGAYSGLMAVLLGFILGAVVGLLLLYGPRVIRALPLSRTSSRFTMGSEIPFAPFLIAAFFMVFLFDVDLIALLGFFI